MIKRVRRVAALSFGLAVCTGVAVATPVSAASATWFSGDGCHNVMRTESGGSLYQSRTGIRAEGGSVGGMSTLTVWYGDTSTTQASSVVEIRDDSTRTYRKGQFRIMFDGARDGECAGESYGRLIDAGAIQRVSSTTDEEGQSAGEWHISASDDVSSGGITVFAGHAGATYSAVFSREQVNRGEARILVTDHSTGESRRVTYDPRAGEHSGVAVTTDVSQ